MNRYEKYDFEEFANLFNGPDAFMLTDELTENMDIRPEMLVLDLGCGNALSSLFLAKEYGCRVYATDPKSSSSNNYAMAKKYGVEKLLIPFCAVAGRLPFMPGTFDCLISIDAWQAFGMEPMFFRNKIAPLLKENAEIGIVVPAVAKALEDKNGHDDGGDVLPVNWTLEKWKGFFENEFSVRMAKRMESAEEAWKRWYRAASPAARKDSTAKWDIGRNVATVMITGTKRS